SLCDWSSDVCSSDLAAVIRGSFSDWLQGRSVPVAFCLLRGLDGGSDNWASGGSSFRQDVRAGGMVRRDTRQLHANHTKGWSCERPVGALRIGGHGPVRCAAYW